MRLYELEDVVENFIITEGIYNHVLVMKDLFFAIEKMKRFERFLPKIKHFIRDELILLDSDLYNKKILREHDNVLGVDWGIDASTKVFGRESLIKLFGGIDYFKDSDVFLVGDLDEIPSREIIGHLKFCNTKQNVFPFKIELEQFACQFNVHHGHMSAPYSRVLNKEYIHHSKLLSSCNSSSSNIDLRLKLFFSTQI
jgi:hypothetical protein